MSEKREKKKKVSQVKPVKTDGSILDPAVEILIDGFVPAKDEAKELKPEVIKEVILDPIGIKFGVDKSSKAHDYLIDYEQILEGKDVKSIMEIGIGDGNCLKMWSTFYPNAQVIGLDIKRQKLINEGNIVSYYCDQSKPASINSVFERNNLSPDVVIEDGSHLWSDQINTFETIFPLLKTGAVYIVEDLHTSNMEAFKNQDIRPLDYFVEVKGAKIVSKNDGNSIYCYIVKG